MAAAPDGVQPLDNENSNAPLLSPVAPLAAPAAAYNYRSII